MDYETWRGEVSFALRRRHSPEAGTPPVNLHVFSGAAVYLDELDNDALLYAYRSGVTPTEFAQTEPLPFRRGHTFGVKSEVGAPPALSAPVDLGPYSPYANSPAPIPTVIPPLDVTTIVLTWCLTVAFAAAGIGSLFAITFAVPFITFYLAYQLCRSDNASDRMHGWILRVANVLIILLLLVSLVAGGSLTPPW